MAEPLLTEHQHQPQTSNCTGAAVVHEEHTSERPPSAEERVPKEDSRWQSRASLQSGSRPGQEGEGGLKHQLPPLQTNACPELSSLEKGEKGQNGEDLSTGGASPSAEGEPMSESLVQPGHDSEAKSDDTSDEDFVEEAGEEDGGSDGMGGDGSEFLQRDFSETYERYHAESLQNMSKQELIKEYLELEKCLSRKEDENNRLRLESKRLGGVDARVRELELELDRLRAENLQLLTENELHRQQERAPLSKFGD